MLPNNEESTSLLGLYQPCTGVRLNLAVDSEGSVAGVTGSSNDVSNQLDRTLLVALRKQSDIIVTSGATARVENLRASKYAPIAVLSESGRLDGLERLLTTDDALPVTLIVPTPVAAQTRVALLNARLSAKVVGLPNLEPSSVRFFLEQEGFKKILLEVGPTLVQLWLTAGAIDEVCLTTTGVQLPSADRVSYLPRDFVSKGSQTLLSSFYSDDQKSRFERIGLGA